MVLESKTVLREQCLVVDRVNERGERVAVENARRPPVQDEPRSGHGIVAMVRTWA